jgi:hypothetical protein
LPNEPSDERAVAGPYYFQPGRVIAGRRGDGHVPPTREGRLDRLLGCQGSIPKAKPQERNHDDVGVRVHGKILLLSTAS